MKRAETTAYGEKKPEPSSQHDPELSAHTALLASIVNSSDDAIIGKTPDGIITSWNRAAEHIYGYSAEEILGKPISILTHQSRPDEMEEILEDPKRREGRALRNDEGTQGREDDLGLADGFADSRRAGPLDRRFHHRARHH